MGLDRAEVEEALSSEERRARHRADLDYALGTLGLDVVPGIFIQGELVRGVPSAARLKKVVDLARQDGPERAGS